MTFLLLGRLTLLSACLGSAQGIPSGLPPSRLAVREGAVWREWWNSARAPEHYTDAAATLRRLVRWRDGAAGAAWAELMMSGAGEAWRTRLVLVRLDPRRVRLALDTAFNDGSAAWSIDRAPTAAVAAVNAGQFVRDMPWGWVLLDGRQFLHASIAPLVSTFTVTGDGGVRLVHGRLPDADGVRWAFQSYPTLLNSRTIPSPLREPGCGVDVAHRDARLALGLDAEGRLLIALTRFDAMGGAFSRVPFGLTTPEMAAIMGSLGAVDAVLLDGGISAQVMVRDAAGTARRWPGVRPVPLALVAYPRTTTRAR